MISHSPAKHSLFPAVATGLATFAALTSMPPWLGVSAALLFFGANGAVWGRRMVPQAHPVWRVFLGAMAVLAALTTLGGAIYYASSLSAPMTALTLLLVGAMTPLIASFPDPHRSVFHALSDAASSIRERMAARKLRWDRIAVSAIASGTVVALTWYAWSLLAGAATDASIRSPWDVAPQLFFVTLFLIALGAACAPFLSDDSPAPILGFSALAALATSVTTLCYRIGFGFDPFIHQATERAIMVQGAVDPKPLYYLGHYAVVTVLARVTSLPVGLFDAWAVPALLALAVPCAYWALRRAFDLPAGAAAFAAGTTFLLLPLAPFIPSTPQGHANVWFLIAAMLCLPALQEGGFPTRALFLFAAAATAVHPLAGIPLLILVAFITVTTVFERRAGTGPAGRLSLTALLILAGSVALPLVFVAQSMVAGGGGAEFDAATLQNPGRILEAVVPATGEARRYIATLDTAYAWRDIRAAAFVAAAALGIALTRRRSRGMTAFAAAAFTLFVNYVLLKSVIAFPFLIAYERSSYADRLANLALFALVPAAATALGFAAERARRSTMTVRLAIPLLAAVAITSSVYLAYPRRDRFENSRGWSTGAQDVAAVRGIENDAKGAPYVVLANQSTSAAAIREFGFRTYYPSHDPQRPGPVFFYPVPTGGPLYEIFLDMNDAGGTYELAKKAMDLAGVDTAYFAVSHYWWDARKITTAARKRADKAWVIDEKVYVFKYTRK